MLQVCMMSGSNDEVDALHIKKEAADHVNFQPCSPSNSNVYSPSTTVRQSMSSFFCLFILTHIALTPQPKYRQIEFQIKTNFNRKKTTSYKGERNLKTSSKIKDHLAVDLVCKCNELLKRRCMSICFGDFHFLFAPNTFCIICSFCISYFYQVTWSQ